MKFSATKEKILEGLQQVQNVVSTRTTLPILSNVLLQAKEGVVNLTTTDLDVGVRGGFEANVDKAGASTLPARRLFTIIRELPSSEISIEVDGKEIEKTQIPSTANPADKVDWRQWHHWNVMKDLTQVTLPKGVSVLTVHVLTEGNMNLGRLEFRRK